MCTLKTHRFRTLGLLVVSVADLICAFEMHAWPEDITIFGDLSAPVLPGDPPAFSLFLVLVVMPPSLSTVFALIGE